MADHSPASQIIFLRHGIATDRENFSGPDSVRPLTELGAKKVLRVAKGLSRLYWPSLIVTSDYVRARETGKICLNVLEREIGEPIQLKETVSLRPNATWAEWNSWQKKLNRLVEPNQSMLVIGHEPNLSRLLGEYLKSPTEIFSLKKAGVAVIDYISNKWCLQALIPPKVWKSRTK